MSFCYCGSCAQKRKGYPLLGTDIWAAEFCCQYGEELGCAGPSIEGGLIQPTHGLCLADGCTWVLPVTPRTLPCLRYFFFPLPFFKSSQSLKVLKSHSKFHCHLGLTVFEISGDSGFLHSTPAVSLQTWVVSLLLSLCCGLVKDRSVASPKPLSFLGRDSLLGNVSDVWGWRMAGLGMRGFLFSQHQVCSVVLQLTGTAVRLPSVVTWRKRVPCSLIPSARSSVPLHVSL